MNPVRMSTTITRIGFCLLITLSPPFQLLGQDGASTENAGQNWHDWRGPLGTGASLDAKPPTSWSEEENIRWKTTLPGLGHSSPIVWGDLVIATSAEPVGEAFTPVTDQRPGSHDNLPVDHEHQYLVLAYDRNTGKERWRTKVAQNIPHEGGHDTGSLASASPATDGQRVYAFFGSHGLFALDRDGRIIWEKQLGKMHSKHGHGEGASPVVHGQQLFVNWDQEGPSFLLALDSATGKENWRVQRDEATSWASPIIAIVDGRPQLVVAGTNRIRGYDTTTGETIWECGGLSANVVATPVYQDGLLIAASSYDTRALLAIDLNGATGDLTDSDRVRWRTNQKTPYIPSPLLYQGQLYYLRHYQGILSRVDFRDGEETAAPVRINGFNEIYSSPVAADDRIYITNREGTTIVISHSQYPRLLSVNPLDDSFSASPALVGTEIFLRGEKHLYAIGSNTTPKDPAEK